MSNTKHTPGPWKNDSANIRWVYEYSSGKSIAVASDNKNTSLEELTANAKLIAAAPEMIDVLDRIYRNVPAHILDDHGIISDLRDVIKKATE